MMGNYRIKEEKSRRGLWPVYGLLMIIAAIGIAYVAGPPFAEWFRANAPSFDTGKYTPEQVDLFFSGLIFIMVMAIAALLLALFVPRSKDTVRDSELAKERKQAEIERKARRKLQRDLSRKQRENINTLD